MRSRMSAQTTGAILLLLALVAWAVVLAEATIVHKVSLLSIGSAVLITGLVFSWPFLHGARAGSGNMVLLRPCRHCGTLPVPALQFCIRCGAYPKAPSMG
ncbi:MAG TPA: hypothetical protein VM286_03100 [Candidatus Thermoplasmatota archaeon]|nr:hypothetical protein [Candidatus Thermoplasmatota archaeon]